MENKFPSECRERTTHLAVHFLPSVPSACFPFTASSRRNLGSNSRDFPLLLLLLPPTPLCWAVVVVSFLYYLSSRFSLKVNFLTVFPLSLPTSSVFLSFRRLSVFGSCCNFETSSFLSASSSLAYFQRFSVSIFSFLFFYFYVSSFLHFLLLVRFSSCLTKKMKDHRVIDLLPDKKG